MDFDGLSAAFDPEAWLAKEIAGDRGTDGWLDSSFRTDAVGVLFREFVIDSPGRGPVRGWIAFSPEGDAGSFSFDSGDAMNQIFYGNSKELAVREGAATLAREMERHGFSIQDFQWVPDRVVS